jgi:hypothetical protein
MARYHQAAMMNGGPMSNVIVAPGFQLTSGIHVHPKAKSNDMMMMGPSFN